MNLNNSKMTLAYLPKRYIDIFLAAFFLSKTEGKKGTNEYLSMVGEINKLWNITYQ